MAFSERIAHEVPRSFCYHRHMFMLGTSWIVFSRWVRYWLTLRIYRNKIAYIDNKPHFTEPLTSANRAVIFAVHLFILGGAAALMIVGFIGVIRLIYG